LIVKSYIIEKNESTLDDYKSVLIYGENQGLREDLKNIIKKKNTDSEIINLFQDEIINNKNILFDETNNVSLFSTKKIIFVHEATDKIFNQIEEILAKPINDLKIIVLANTLEKKTKLRNIYEKDKKFAVVPCYLDNEMTLSFYINKQLKNIKGVNQEIINLLINNSNSDRKTISNEIKKIVSYGSKKEINYETVQKLINIKSDTAFSKIRDASLTGDKKKVNQLLSEVEFRNEDIFMYLYSLNTRVLKLYEIHNINKDVRDIELSIETLKMKIFWKDKPIFINQLKKWDIEKLQKILLKIGNIEQSLKTDSNIRNDIVLKDLLIKICGEASNSA
jgi:DNA polymerase-3 subunit delta